MLRVVSIEDGFEQTFWNIVNKDPLDYYFFILDWKNRRDQTKILLATEEERVKGMVILYADRIVQLRGDTEAVRLLLDSVDLDSVELQAPPDCREIVLEKYRPFFMFDLVLMRLRRGEEHVQINSPPVKLGAEDIDEAVDVLRRADPEVWGDLSIEQQRANWQDALLLGIRHDDKLVSVGLTRFVDFASNISAIATDHACRNRGYATSIVSALVTEILQRSPIALIHVRADNTPAVKAYSKVGFKPYKHYCMMRAKKIRG